MGRNMCDVNYSQPGYAHLPLLWRNVNWPAVKYKGHSREGGTKYTYKSGHLQKWASEALAWA